jgi:hypothetical protein
MPEDLRYRCPHCNVPFVLDDNLDEFCSSEERLALKLSGIDLPSRVCKRCRYVENMSAEWAGRPPPKYDDE